MSATTVKTTWVELPTTAVKELKEDPERAGFMHQDAIGPACEAALKGERFTDWPEEDQGGLSYETTESNDSFVLTGEAIDLLDNGAWEEALRMGLTEDDVAIRVIVRRA